MAIVMTYRHTATLSMINYVRRQGAYEYEAARADAFRWRLKISSLRAMSNNFTDGNNVTSNENIKALIEYLHRHR